MHLTAPAATFLGLGLVLLGVGLGVLATRVARFRRRKPSGVLGGRIDPPNVSRHLPPGPPADRVAVAARVREMQADGTWPAHVRTDLDDVAPAAVLADGAPACIAFDPARRTA